MPRATSSELAMTTEALSFERDAELLLNTELLTQAYEYWRQRIYFLKRPESRPRSVGCARRFNGVARKLNLRPEMLQAFCEVIDAQIGAVRRSPLLFTSRKEVVLSSEDKASIATSTKELMDAAKKRWAKECLKKFTAQEVEGLVNEVEEEKLFAKELEAIMEEVDNEDATKPTL